MKAQRAFGLDLSWPRVAVVFLIDVAVLVLASHWPGEPPTASYVWWSGVGVAVLVTITALTSYRRIPITSVLAARALDRFADPEAVSAGGRTRLVDHQRRYGRELVGMREYQGQLVTVIAVGGPAAAVSGRHHRGTESTVTLPVDLVAAGLRQFDVRLDGIDIVSVGVSETPADDVETAAADSDAPDTHAPAASGPDHRNTWLVLRMDTERNVTAVAARDSVAATLAAATERLAHDLDRRNITARVLTAEEFTDVDTAVLAGLQPAQTPARWRRLNRKQLKGHVTSFWVSPQDITSENLVQLWEPATNTTVVTVRLTPRYGRTEVSVLVRYHSRDRLPKKVLPGLNRLTGRQLTAVCTSLPTLRRPALVMPVQEMHDQEHLAVPLDPEPQRPVVRIGAQQ
jgi:type VII secretion protein EccE